MGIKRIGEEIKKEEAKDGGAGGEKRDELLADLGRDGRKLTRWNVGQFLKVISPLASTHQ